MAKEKEQKTNAMRLLEKHNVPYTTITYPCDEFTDGVTVATLTGQNPDQSFKTLVTVGKGKNYYVFVIPVKLELDLKLAAASVNEKSVEMIPVKDITQITGYVRGGCSPLAMKKQFVTIIDNSACEFENIYISGGRLGLTLCVNPKLLLSVINGSFLPLTLNCAKKGN